MKKWYQKEKAITLIALIVTIIILLILAGISLNLITGEEGILKKATDAVERNQSAAEQEQIELAITNLKLAYYQDYETRQNQTVQDYILQNCENNPITISKGGVLSRNSSSKELVYQNQKGSKQYIQLSEEGNIVKIFSDGVKNDSLNIIFMIGDGMGQNHIKAGEINKGSKLHMQTIPNQAEVTTYSFSVANEGASATDSAASATALATGVKTKNYYVGKDIVKNNVQNLTEYSRSLGLKVGTVSTQTIYHATPAGFTAHTSDRNNYWLIAKRQITEEQVDLMIGGGQEQFNGFPQEMAQNGYNYVTNFTDLANYTKDEKVIGAFSWDRMTKDGEGNAKPADPSLVEMTKAAIARLENDNGFFVMIEGSDIDTYSHKGQMGNMLNELNGFDNAVKVAMDYVDTHPNTLLIVTADHETGGLNLENITAKEELTDQLFQNGSNGYYDHTNSNVLVYSYGKDAEELMSKEVIDNTDIHRFVRRKLQENDEAYKVTNQE